MTDLLQKNISLCIFGGFGGFGESWEKGFILETPKKYTFALDGFHWVLFSMDFSKIAVLFWMFLSFCVFCNKKIVDFETFFDDFLFFCVVLCCVVLCCVVL